MAKFQVGNNLSHGRPAGSLNKRSLEFLAVLEKNNFCTASAILDLYKTSLECFIEDREKETTGRISPIESNAPKYMKMCADLLSALASYAYPKLKSIDYVRPGQLDGMTPEQKLKAAEYTVEMLRMQVKGNGSGPGTNQ